MSLSELKRKDVVNVDTGKRLGKVMDIEFDECTGCVEALVVPAAFQMGALLKGEKCGIVIPWQRVCRIGDDVILVKLEPGDIED